MSQNIKILIALKNGMKLTAIGALNMFGCFRLAARIKDLRDEGYHVESEMIRDEKTGKIYSVYWMGKNEKR